MPTGHRFLATDLHQFVVSLFTHLGSTPGEATLVADHLIAANLAGHDSHGVGMIPSYVKSHAGGFLQLNRHATVTKDAAPWSPSTATPASARWSPTKRCS